MINPLAVEGQRFLVTGASSGLGREIAILLSELGGQVGLVSRNEAGLTATLANLHGRQHKVFPFDLSNLDEIADWLKDVANEMGNLHGMVHSAGVQLTRPLRAMKLSQCEELLRINLSAAIALTQAYSQRAVRAETGSIVLLSSVMGFVGQAALGAYCASKGGLVAFAKSAAIELARNSIRVNCVAPGHVETEMARANETVMTPEQYESIASLHPLGTGTPRDVANAVAFLLAGTGRWITGTTLVLIQVRSDGKID